MPYLRISTKVSNYLISELNYPDEKKDIIAYAMDSVILMVAGFAMVMAVGFLLDVPGATFFAILAGDLLRKASGGAHFAAPLPCLLFSAVTYPLVSWAGVQAFYLWGERPVYYVILLCICMVCLVIVSILAPVDCEAKPIISPTFRKKLKYASILLVLFFSIVALLYKETYVGISLVGGLTFQSMTLLPFFNDRKNKEV